jgi:hypothetical protein
MMNANHRLSPEDTARFAAIVIPALKNTQATTETPNSFMQQLGLMTLLFDMTLQEQDLTTVAITKTTKIHRLTLNRLYTELHEKKMLERDAIINTHGKGQTFLYRFPAALLAKIAHQRGGKSPGSRQG